MKSELFIASETGNISLFRTALGKGADINQVDENGSTPLMIACKYGHTPLVKFILSRGAEITLSDNKGMTAIKHAELSNKADLIEFFKDLIEEESEDENTIVQEHFRDVLDNVFPVSKQIEPIIKNLSELQRMEIKNDLIKILLLFRSQED